MHLSSDIQEHADNAIFERLRDKVLKNMACAIFLLISKQAFSHNFDLNCLFVHYPYSTVTIETKSLYRETKQTLTYDKDGLLKTKYTTIKEKNGIKTIIETFYPLLYYKLMLRQVGDGSDNKKYGYVDINMSEYFQFYLDSMKDIQTALPVNYPGRIYRSRYEFEQALQFELASTIDNQNVDKIFGSFLDSKFLGDQTKISQAFWDSTIFQDSIFPGYGPSECHYYRTQFWFVSSKTEITSGSFKSSYQFISYKQFERRGIPIVQSAFSEISVIKLPTNYDRTEKDLPTTLREIFLREKDKPGDSVVIRSYLHDKKKYDDDIFWVETAQLDSWRYGLFNYFAGFVELPVYYSVPNSGLEIAVNLHREKTNSDRGKRNYVYHFQAKKRNNSSEGYNTRNVKLRLKIRRGFLNIKSEDRVRTKVKSKSIRRSAYRYYSIPIY